MKRLMRLFLYLNNIIILILSHVSLYACPTLGPGEHNYQYHFFQYEGPSHVIGSEMYFYNESLTLKNANLIEWKKYFNGCPEKEDIEEILYNSTYEKLTLIKNSLFKKSEDISDIYDRNTFLRCLKKTNDHEFINYLIQTRICEPYMRVSKSQIEKSDSLFMDAKIADFKEMYSQSSSFFLKERYAYQMIRLARYSNQPTRAILIYTDLMESNESTNMIKYWAMEHVAGIYTNRGKETLKASKDPDRILSGKDDISKGQEMFTRVFNECSSKRMNKLLDLNITSDEGWTEAINLCKNEQEKITLYARRAMKRNSNIFEEMRSIYELDPSSSFLKSLLREEIFFLEHQLLGKDLKMNILTARETIKIPKKQTIKILEQLIYFTSNCINNKFIKDKEFWKLANGYLNILAGNINNTRKTINDLNKHNLNIEEINQIRTFELLIDIISIDKINDEIENKLFLVAKELKNPYMAEFLIKVFGILYEQQGLSTKALLCNNSHLNFKGSTQNTDRFNNKDFTVFEAIKQINDNELIENILNFKNKRNKTKFEEFLVTSTLNKHITWEGTKAITKDDFLHILGTIAMRDNRLDDAISHWELMSDKNLLEISRNPFEVKILDNIHPDGNSALSYNKLIVVKELITLLKSLNAPSSWWDILSSTLSTTQSETSYKIGNYYFNSTYFGHSWAMQASSRKYRSYSSNYFYQDEVIYQDKDNLNFKTPLYYYDKCIELSKGIIDNEFAAKSAFMAAKCEQSLYISDLTLRQLKTIKGKWYEYESLVFPNYKLYGKYFRMLRDEYSDTDYYQNVINGCKYFNYFINEL